MTVVPVDGLNDPRFVDYRSVPDPAPVPIRLPEPLSAIADAARRLIPFPTSMPALPATLFAAHHVMADDTLRPLASMKSVWGARLTTVSVRQGNHARDANTFAAYPAGGASFGCIGDLARSGPPAWLEVAQA